MKSLKQLIALMVYLPMAFGDAYPDTDVSAGKHIYVQCTGCHAPDYNRTGPMHCGLVGRVAGAVSGFEYTKAMKNSGIVWTSETLDKFLESPFAMVPGTSMGFSGMPSKQDRQQLIAYLTQLDDRNDLCK